MMMMLMSSFETMALVTYLDLIYEFNFIITN